MESGQNSAFISVIVPFRNNKREIERCCESLVAQEYPADRFEIIFVENNCTDGSDALVARFRRIQLLSEPELGSYAARNRGLLSARGDIFAFTDADCVASPGWLRSIADAMTDPAAKILMGSYCVEKSNFPVCALSAYENAKNRYIFSSTDESLYYGYTNNMAVRRDVVDRLGPFPQRMRGGDAMLVRRQVRAQGVDTVQFLSGMCVQHLEFQTVPDYYRKVFVHSQSIRSFRDESPLRPLSQKERLHAFREMVRHEGYSRGQSAVIFSILAGGLGAWVAGALLWGSPEHARTPQRSHNGLGNAPQPQRAGERRNQ